jgi:hypothetical protein
MTCSTHRGDVGNPGGRRPTGKPRDADGKIILIWIIKKQYGRMWTVFIWFD